jgi:cytochrome bd-type quinol oxidase subunit 2
MITKVLYANGSSCLLFGALFLAWPAGVARFLGNPPVWLIAVLGAGLILNGLHLVWAARRGPGRKELLHFTLGDGAWVAATLLLIASGLWITTTPGILAALACALPVGTFGVLQARAAARARTPAG